MKKPILSLLALLTTLAVSHGSVVYRETFGNNTTSSLTLLNIGSAWKCYSGSNATTGYAVDLTSSKTCVSNIGGTPYNLPNVGTIETTLSAANGVVYTNQFLSLFETTEMTLDATAPTTFSWYQKNSTATAGFRVVVEIGNTWYASSQLFTNTAGASSFTYESFTFTTAASSWQDLNFVAGTTAANTGVLTLSSSVRTVDLPTGNITGFGLLSADSTGNTQRFDTFTVDGVAVPEPSVVGLLSLAAGAGFFLRKKVRFCR